MDREKGFVKALSQQRSVCNDLFGLIKDEEKAKIRRWEDERPSLELLLSSLNQTCDILKKEKKRLASELSGKQQSVFSSTSQGARPVPKGVPTNSSSHHGKDPAALQRELDELNSRVQATDIEIQIANEELVTCERADEREYLSTKCVVLQDTRRILAEEMHALRSDLARLDASSRVEAERRRAEESGWAEVARLEEQLDRTTTRLDRVKQQMYFPEAKGYRFSSGNGGIYVGARDLHLSEVSGRFEFTCEPIKRTRTGGHPQQAQPQQAGGPAGPGGAGSNRVARLTVVLGGVSASTALAERPEIRRSGAAGLNPGGGATLTDPVGRSSFKHSRSSGGNLAASGVSTGSGGSGSTAGAPVGPGAGISGGASSKSLGGFGGPGAVAEGLDSPAGSGDPALLSSAPQQPPQQHPPAGATFPSPRPSAADSPVRGHQTAAPGPGSAGASPSVPTSASPGASGAGGSAAAASASMPGTPTHHLPNPLSQSASATAALGAPSSPGAAVGAGASAPGRSSPAVGGSAAGEVHGQQQQQPPPQQQPLIVRPELLPGQLPPEQHPQQLHPLHSQHHPLQPPSQPLQGYLQGPGLPLRPASSEPPPAAGVPPPSNAQPLPPGHQHQHRRMASYEAAGTATPSRGGGPPPPYMPYGPPTMTALPPPRAKGEAVANFLSGLKNKKEKLKNMVGVLVGDRERQGAAGQQQQQQVGPGGYEGVYGDGDPRNGSGGVQGAGGRLKSQMMEKLQDGFSESKGKLSRIGKAIAAKAPEALRDMKTKIRPGGRGGSGGGAGGGEGDWEDGLSYGSPSAAAAQSFRFQPPYPGPQQQPQPQPQAQAQAQQGSLLLDNSAATLLAAVDNDYFGRGAAGTSAATTGASSAVSPGAASAGGAVAGQAAGGAVAAAAVAPAGVGLQAEPGGGLDGPGPNGGKGSRGGAADAEAGAGSPEDSDAESVLLGGFVEDFECRPSRKGVYVQLLGERVELLGERGTKVPDMSIREIMLEVEVAVTAVFEYHATGAGNAGGAWLAPEPVSFNILQLDHHMRGNNIPLPKTLLKGLLNAYMPGLLTRLLAGLLPAELGTYTATSGETQALSGEFKVAGPSLSTMVNTIAPAPKPPSDPAKRTKWAAAQAAAGRARAMLGLSDGQAAAVSELFGGCGRPSLVPDSAGFSPSISGLCRFFVTYSQSGLWQPLLGVLDRALQAAFDFHGVRPAERFAAAGFFEGPVARLVRKPLRIAFSIERLSVALDCDAALATIRDYFERLAREFEAKGPNRSADADPSGPPREPLEVQLELLDLWHASLAKLLRTFKQRFRSGGATLLASADRRVFQFGAESVSYDGPLKLKFPLDLAMDPDGAFIIDVKLPDREEATNSITSLLTEVMYSLSTTHNQAAAAAAAAAATAAAAPAPHAGNGQNQISGPAAAVYNNNTAFTAQQHQQQQHQQQGQGQTRAVPGAGPFPGPPSHASTMQAVVARAAAVQGALSGSGGGGSGASSLAGNSDGGCSGSGGGGGQDSPAARGAPPLAVAAAAAPSALYDIGHEWAAALVEGMPEGSALASGTAPLLQNPVVGQLCVKKLALNLRLDEERIAQLLSGAGAAVVTHPLTHPHGHGHGHHRGHTARDGNPAANAPTAQGALPGSQAGAAEGGSVGGAAGTAGADIAGRLLGCYGDLFTASLDMGWRAESEADGAAQKPCCMLTVQSNDITRLRAEVEGLWFQSSVSPRLAVRVLQAVVIALVLKFHAADSYSIRFWNRAFNQLYEYLSRGSLDIAICLSARATMDRPTDRLRVELSGQDLNASAGGQSAGGGVGGGTGASGAAGLLGRVCPVYLLNDVNLMTVLDTMKLLSETAPAPHQQQQQQQQ